MMGETMISSSVPRMKSSIDLLSALQPLIGREKILKTGTLSSLSKPWLRKRWPIASGASLTLAGMTFRRSRICSSRF